MLAGDLDFFCRLCKKDKLSIFILDFFIVSMSCGGISSKKHFRRTIEVINAYKSITLPFYAHAKIEKQK